MPTLPTLSTPAIQVRCWGNIDPTRNAECGTLTSRIRKFITQHSALSSRPPATVLEGGHCPPYILLPPPSPPLSPNMGAREYGLGEDRYLLRVQASPNSTAASGIHPFGKAFSRPPCRFLNKDLPSQASFRRFPRPRHLVE